MWNSTVLRLILCSVVLMLLNGGCNPKLKLPESLRSAAARPSWIGQVPKPDNEYLYFRGIRTGVERLEAGEHDAVQAAVRQILEFLGQEGIVYYAQDRDELQTRIIDRVSFKSSGTVVGARLLELYFEKNFYRDGTGLYDVFVLVRFPRKELKRERQRYENRLKTFFISGGKKYQQGMDYWNQGRQQIALSYLLEAKAFIGRIPASKYPHLLASFGGRDIQQEINRLTVNASKQHQIGNVQVRMRDASLASYPFLSQPLEKLHELYDFTIFLPDLNDRKQSRYRIAVELSFLKTDSSLGNIVSADAGCQVKLIETESDQVVYKISGTSMGFGSSSQKAAVDAMDNCISRGVMKMGVLLDSWSAGSV